jgi:hypothetical protein
MPIIRDISLNLNMRDVLRRQGLGEVAKVRPEIKILIQELLASLECSCMLKPVSAYEYYTVRSMNDSQILLEGGKAIHGPLLPATFPDAKELVILLCTIGPGLEKQVTDYTNRAEPLRAMLLDGIGSAAVDKMVVEVLKRLASESSSRSYEISSPVNPGMPGFPLTEQWNLLKLVNAGEIGVRLTSSGVMVPRKSVSMVAGIGPEMKRWTQAKICARCKLSKTCHYKVTEQG